MQVQESDLKLELMRQLFDLVKRGETPEIRNTGRRLLIKRLEASMEAELAHA